MIALGTSALVAILLQDGYKFSVPDYGDTFAYALAGERGVALLFKGTDFGQTDITSAV